MNDTPEHEPAGKQEPTAWQVLAPLADLVTPMAVRVAATLGLADLMAQRPLSPDEMARRSGTDPDALDRLLRHLVNHGVFTEPTPGVFALNDLATLLCSDHPSGMRVQLDLDGFGGQMDLAFTGLLHTVRTGRPAWEEVFGAPFWDYLAADPVMGASFDATMTAGAEYVADDAQGYDWSTVAHVVDVGGGTGALLVAILQAHPGVHATLVDLPDTVERAREQLTKRGLSDRCTFVGQDFFDALPGGGDVYVLNSVLHDWAEQEATSILRRCAEAAADTGRIVIIEETGAGEDRGSEFAEMDLRMLVLCGGRERSIDGYTAIASAAGLEVARTHTTPLGQAVIECVSSACGGSVPELAPSSPPA